MIVKKHIFKTKTNIKRIKKLGFDIKNKLGFDIKILNNYKSNCLKLKQVQINEMPIDYGEFTYYNKHITQHKIRKRDW